VEVTTISPAARWPSTWKSKVDDDKSSGTLAVDVEVDEDKCSGTLAVDVEVNESKSSGRWPSTVMSMQKVQE
jgi:hypothetical protein